MFFGLFKKSKPEPSKSLEQLHEETLAQAMQAQRNGEMEDYLRLRDQADQYWQQLKAERDWSQ